MIAMTARLTRSGVLLVGLEVLGRLIRAPQLGFAGGGVACFGLLVHLNTADGPGGS
jgi:hypothetical protein